MLDFLSPAVRGKELSLVICRTWLRNSNLLTLFWLVAMQNSKYGKTGKKIIIFSELGLYMVTKGPIPYYNARLVVS